MREPALEPHDRAQPRARVYRDLLGVFDDHADATIVNVAFGPIGADLGGALSTAQWIVNGYTLGVRGTAAVGRGAGLDRIGSRTGFLSSAWPSSG